jgi:hypothetical protein
MAALPPYAYLKQTGTYSQFSIAIETRLSGGASAKLRVVRGVRTEITGDNAGCETNIQKYSQNFFRNLARNIKSGSLGPSIIRIPQPTPRKPSPALTRILRG